MKKIGEDRSRFAGAGDSSGSPDQDREERTPSGLHNCFMEAFHAKGILSRLVRKRERRGS